MTPDEHADKNGSPDLRLQGADPSADEGPLLLPCDPVKCEAMCCHDGAYLAPGEETSIAWIVSRNPALASALPAAPFVDGVWRGEPYGRKTATRPHQYSNPDRPSHFPSTRCVFADESGLCSLESLAREMGIDPWAFKPSVCSLFPVHPDSNGKPAPPPTPELDPCFFDDYPGFASAVPCGKPNPDGKPWRQALSKEIRFLELRRTKT